MASTNLDKLLQLGALASLVQAPEKPTTWTPGGAAVEFTSKTKQQKVGGLGKKQVVKLIETILESTQDESMFTDAIIDKLGGGTESAIVRLRNHVGALKIDERAACNTYTACASRRLLVRLVRLFCALTGSILADTVPNKSNTFAEFTAMCIENWKRIVTTRKVTMQDIKNIIDEGIAEAATERSDMLLRIPMLGRFCSAGVGPAPATFSSGSKMLEQLQQMQTSSKSLALSDSTQQEKIQRESLAPVDKSMRRKRSKRNKTLSTSSSTSSSTLSRTHRKNGKNSKKTDPQIEAKASISQERIAIQDAEKIQIPEEDAKDSADDEARSDDTVATLKPDSEDLVA
jgi:hypothetical protein